MLGIGGAKSLREQVADTMKLTADVQTLVIPGCGHGSPERTGSRAITHTRTHNANRRTWRSLPGCRPVGSWPAGMVDRYMGLVA